MTPSPEGKRFSEPDSLHYERVFQQDKTDAFLLLQLKDTPETAEMRFENLQYLEKKGFTVSYENYAAVYAGTLTPGQSRQETLDDLYTRFNIDRPPDFTGHSLSVSDIIVLREQGQVSCHYVDSRGFQELSQFLPENYLKNTEMAMEDDYSMIDGIINNGRSAAAVQREGGEKEQPSILEKLRGFKRTEPLEITEKKGLKGNMEKEL